MVDFILNALVYILAIYGLIEIIKTIYYIMNFNEFNKEDIYIIIGTTEKTKEKINSLKEDDESIIVTDWSEFKRLVDTIDNE